MTIKWVKVDPLVMRGEPFCYNTRLTVRQLLELRRDGYEVARLMREHPELRVVGIAHAYRYASEHRPDYGEFFDRDGRLVGPGLNDDEAAVLPEALRIPGVVVAAPKITGRTRPDSTARASAEASPKLD
jgi:uncharacterized protein (DUF433 family)